jgi:hypothetical protein
MKSIESFYSEMGDLGREALEERKRQICNNILPQLRPDQAASPVHSIVVGFYWTHSKKGFRYWAQVADNLRKEQNKKL